MNEELRKLFDKLRYHLLESAAYDRDTFAYLDMIEKQLSKKIVIDESKILVNISKFEPEHTEFYPFEEYVLTLTTVCSTSVRICKDNINEEGKNKALSMAKEKLLRDCSYNIGERL